MSVLGSLRRLILGETWTLPLGVAAVIAASAVLHHVAPKAWHHAGGFLLLAGVIAVLALAQLLDRRPPPQP